MQIGILTKEKLKLQAYVGPQFGYLLKLENIFDGEKEKFEFGEDDEISRIDFALNAGIVLEFNGPFLGFNYNYGLANIDDSDEDVKISHRVLSVILGYKF